MDNLKSKKLTYRLAAALFFFMIGSTFAAWASRIPDIKEHLNITDGQLGTALLGLPIGQMLAMAVSGHLVGKFGSKKMLSIGMLLYPLGFIFIAFCNSYYQFIAALLATGIFANLSNISVNTQAVGVERLYGKSIMAAFHGVWSLAGFLGGLLSYLVVKLNISVLTHFSVVYAIVAILAIFAQKYLLPQDIAEQAKQHPTPKHGVNLPDMFLVLLGFTAFSSMACEGTMFNWSGVYFKSVVNAPKEYVSLGYTAFMCLMATGRFCGDFFINRFGHTNVMKFSGVLIFFGLTLSVAMPTMLFAALGFAFVGMGVSSIVPLSYSLAGRSKTMDTGNAIATVATIGFFGFLMGPPIIGFLSDKYSLRVSFLTIALVGLLMTAISPLVKRKLAENEK